MHGLCGLFPLEDSGLIEIGYRFITPAWGKGIATEAATLVLDHGFRKLAIGPIVAVTHPENLGSQRVLTKIGLRSMGLRYHYGLDLSFFSLSSDDYLTSQ
jgi:RimJ/RimL family protein N-acetyltransferase